MKTPIPIVGGSYTDESRELNCQRTLNLYVRGGGPDGLSQRVLKETPGLMEVTRLGNGASRGYAVVQDGALDVLIAVIGNKVMRSGRSWAARQVGTIVSTTGPVTISSNGQQVLIVDSISRSTVTRAYIYDMVADTLTDLNTGLFRVDFTLGGEEPRIGGTFTGDASSGSFVLLATHLLSGSWAGNDAAGYLYCQSISGTPGLVNGSPTPDQMEGPPAAGGADAVCFTIGAAPVFYGIDFHPTRGAVIDGRFLLLEANSGRFWWSAPYDGFEWSGLAFATAESDPDNLVSLAIVRREVWLFGESVTEVWTPTGVDDLPFQRVAGSAIEWGCDAIASPVVLDNKILWLGKNRQGGFGTMLMGISYSEVASVSTPAMVQQFSEFSKRNDAFAIGYSYDHNFVELTFPTMEQTWLFDMTTGEWSELGEWDSDTATLKRHRSNCHAVFAGRHLVGDYESGKVFEMVRGFHYDGNVPIMRERVLAHASGAGSWIRFKYVELDVKTGVGEETGGIYSNPVILMSYSDDRGHTFGPEIPGSLGTVGQTAIVVEWHRLGRSKDRVFRFRSYGPFPLRIFGMRAGLEGT